MQETELTLPAPAKINLFLHIIGRRSDGYHELQTIFQLLDLADQLSFKTTKNSGVKFTCNNLKLENDENLVFRAAQVLEQHTGRRFNVHIHLDKQLPIGGGIGGGSSDCASTLLGLNQLYNLQISQQELIKIGAKLGADVPVFIKGVSAWAEGIGEKLTPLTLAEQWYLIIHPDQHVSTPKLFAHPQLTRNTPASTIRPALADTGHNDFEPLVRTLFPTIEKAFIACAPYGKARLTGSGACLFLKMQNEMAARNVLNSMKSSNPEITTFIAKGTNVSPVIDKLKHIRT